jgi:predicted transcriptional regulator
MENRSVRHIVYKNVKNVDPTVVYTYFMLFLLMMSVGAFVTTAIGVWRVVGIISIGCHS